MILNGKKDLFLTAQLRTFLKRRDVDHDIDSFHTSAEIYQNLYTEHKWFEYWCNVFTLISNQKKGRDLFEGLVLDKLHLSTLRFIEKTVNEMEFEYDVYCFSTYRVYLLDHLMMTFLLRRKWGDPKILFGGPHVILVPQFKNLVERLKILYSYGDIGPTVYNLFSKGFVDPNSSENYDPLTHKTFEDMPELTPDELEYLDYTVNIVGSRSCANSCHYCCSPKLCRYGFNYLPRKIFAEWVIEYVNQGAKLFRLNDNSLTTHHPKEFLQPIIDANLGVEFRDVYANLMDIDEDLCGMLKKAGFNALRIGLECIQPKMAKLMNRKMPTKKDTWRRMEILHDHGIQTWAFMIVGIPGQTRADFDEEMEFYEALHERYPDTVRFDIYSYYQSNGSYMSRHPEEFGIQVKEQLDPRDFPEIPEFEDDIRAIEDRFIEYEGRSEAPGRWHEAYNRLVGPHPANIEGSETG